MTADLIRLGWQRFGHEDAVAAWAEVARAVAGVRVRAPEERQWLRCGGTWFVGVDTLPNDSLGRVGGSEPLTGAAIDLATALYGALPLHRAQVSVIYPGYPKPWDGESDAAFGFRLRRDAAHVDGLLPVGDARRRHLIERHAYILGVPLTECDPGASPVTVWEGSHRIVHHAFARVLKGTPQDRWPGLDLTDIYHTARRQVFESCTRRLLPARPGETYLVHRLALHGVAPWETGAQAPEEGRMIAYFRPEWTVPGDEWLTSP